MNGVDSFPDQDVTAGPNEMSPHVLVYNLKQALNIWNATLLHS